MIFEEKNLKKMATIGMRASFGLSCLDFVKSQARQFKAARWHYRMVDSLYKVNSNELSYPQKVRITTSSQ